MHCITGGRLLRLRKQHLFVLHESYTKGNVPLRDMADMLDIDHRRGTRDLNDGPVQRDTAVKNNRGASEFSPGDRAKDNTTGGNVQRR
jgi:hypothetical protein